MTLPDIIAQTELYKNRTERLEIISQEAKDIRAQMMLLKKEIFEKYKKAKVNPDECDHPLMLHEHFSGDSSNRCGYCSYPVD
ncbi:hypothetical protein GOV13_03425 [Candidatus Pacearchaeota archaeon]|nr:hypothetical protein [Candidatus Pacearchaeota archaeon]